MSRTTRRVLYALLTIFAAITVNFVIFRAAPGDAASLLGQCRQCAPDYAEQLRETLGLDKSLLQQYLLYLKEMATGNLGDSFTTNQPVWPTLRTAILNTLPMLILANLIGAVVGVTLGLVAAWRRGTVVDSGLLGISLLVYSLPVQWLGLMFILAFAGVLPTAGIVDPSLALLDPSWLDQARDRLEHMILPAATIGLIMAGQYALLTRTSILETLGDDYVLTARARGLTPFRAIRTEVLPNAVIPLLALGALHLGYLVGGAILVETVFSYPGVGQTMYQAVQQRDYPTLQAAFLVMTVAVVLANLAVDLVLPRIDPRLRRRLA